MFQARLCLLMFTVLTGFSLSPTTGCKITAVPTPTMTPTLTPTLTPTPPAVEVAGWKGMQLRTLCLKVSGDFLFISAEIEQASKRILERMGLQLMDKEGPCDATLTIHMNGQAIGASYYGKGGIRQCYSGAEVSGEITLSAPGRKPLILPVKRRLDPPSSIIGYCNTNPREAPFDWVWGEALLDGLTGIWGWHPAIQALRDENFVVREAAIKALNGIGPEAKEAVPALVQALKDENSDIRARRSAVYALGKIGPGAKEAVPALVQALEDKDSIIREAAAHVLGKIGPEAKEAVPTLIQALNDKEWHVRGAVADALKEITGYYFGTDVSLWREWWEKQGR